MKTLIVFLGTSAAVPTKNRGLPAIALKHGADVFLFDVGEGTQYRLIRAGLSPVKVTAVFITHLHGDHVFGLPGLLQSMSMYDRKTPLHIYGPKGLAYFVESSMKATGHKPPFEVSVHEDLNSIVYGNVRIRLFPVDHGMKESYGYVIEIHKPLKLDVEKLREIGVPVRYWSTLQRGRDIEFKGRTIRARDVLIERPPVKIVYTGDTRPIMRTVEEAKNAEILIHDSTTADDLAEEAHEEGHSSAGDAGRIAYLAGVKLLVLTHISARYTDTRTLLSDAKRYHSNTIVAEDYMIIPVD